MTRGVIIIILTLMSGCVGYREKQVEFVTQEELNAREARLQCKVQARSLLQIARCDGR